MIVGLLLFGCKKNEEGGDRILVISVSLDKAELVVEVNDDYDN